MAKWDVCLQAVNDDELLFIQEILAPDIAQAQLDKANLQVKKALLSFYPGVAYYEIIDSSSKKALRMLYKPGYLRWLNWTNEVIYEANSELGIVIDDDSIIDYVKFFFYHVRGQLGSFCIVEQVDEVDWAEGAGKRAKTKAAKLLKPVSLDAKREQEFWVLSGTVVFRSSLFSTGIIVFLSDGEVVASETGQKEAVTRGQIQLANEDLLIEVLPVNPFARPDEQLELFPEETATRCSIQAEVLANQIRYEEAAERYQQASALCSEWVGEEHSTTIKGLAHQAWAWLMADRIQDSFGLCQRLVEIRSRKKDSVHADALAAVGILASSIETAAEREKGRKPLEFLRHALALRQSFLGEEEAASLAALKKLAKLLTIFAETKEAEALFRQQLAICRRIFGEEHLQTAQACHELADYLYETGSFSESAKLCQTACSLREILLGRDDLETSRSYKLLGLLHGSAEKYADAVKLLKAGLVILEQKLRPDHCEVYRTYREIATCCRMLNEFDEAVDWQKKALLNCQTAQSDQSVEYGVYCQDMARIYLAKKKFDEAQSWAEKSYELIKQDNELFALHLLFMANMANLRKRLAEGLGYADQALFLFKQEKEPNQLYIALCYDELAMLHYERGQLDKALELAKTAADTLVNNGMSETRYANSVNFHLAFLQDRKKRLG